MPLPTKPKLLPSLLFLLSFLLISVITKSDPLIYKECPNNTNYITNSTFQHNLNNLLSSLPSAAVAASGFSNETVGRQPDQAYGLALCRGDVSSSDCQACLNTSVRDLATQCPDNKVATLWYDHCLLRYSNASFFGTADTSFMVYLSNRANVTQPAQFDALLGQLMDNLTTKAAYRSPRMFAAGTADFTSFSKIYGLVWCTRDLSGDECFRCLTSFVGFIPSCCNGKQGGQVFGPSCLIRFELYPFYNILGAEAAMAPAPAPTTISPPAGPRAGNGSDPRPENAGSKGKPSLQPLLTA